MKKQFAASPFDDGMAEDRRGFSLVLGGPLFQLLCAAHLSDDALYVVHRRIIALILLAWLPLLILSLVGGHALAGSVAVPFLRDVEVHIRFLVALPLLVIAELVVHERMHPIVEQFLKRRLIPENAVASFHAALGSAMRLRNSVLAEVVIIAAVYLVGVFVWRHFMSLDTATWYASSSRDGSRLSLAGTWYCFVSLPLFQFLLIRWYFRILIWARFLWQVSRIKLVLIPSHPDRVGGLGFLAGTLQSLRSRPHMVHSLLGLSPTGFSTKGPRCSVQVRDRCCRHIHAVLNVGTTSGVLDATCICEAVRRSRIWGAGRRLCPRVPCEVGARQTRRRASCR